MGTAVDTAFQQLGLSARSVLAGIIRRLEQDVANQASQGPGVFGLGDLGEVVLGPGPHLNFDGLRDYVSLTVDPAAVVSPGADRLLVVRAQKEIVWNGTLQGAGIFTGFQGFIALGSQAQSGAGGGGGGGDSLAPASGDAGRASDNGQTQGGGYDPGTGGVSGSGGAGGAPGVAGADGTVGVPGLASTFFQETALGVYPGITPAIGAILRGAPGIPGGAGGDGAQGPGGPGIAGGGAGGTSGLGGPGGALVILASPKITFGPAAVFNLQGLAGTPGVNGSPGAAGNVATFNGGGGGGGAGGSGGQGGCGGVLLVYYGSLVGSPPFVLNISGGPGGAGGLGGAAGGNGGGAGSPGGAGGKGAAGPAGSLGFMLERKIVL